MAMIVPAMPAPLQSACITPSPALPVARDVARALDIPGVWSAGQRTQEERTRSSGLREIDSALGGGWPEGSLIQIATDHPGLGLSLITPLLANLTQSQRRVAIVQPPFIPYAPALCSRGVDLGLVLWLQPARAEDSLWTVEQLARSGLLGGIAYWGESMESTAERRLQLAASEGDAIAFHFVSRSRNAHSYAAVRLEVFPSADGVDIDVLKCRGGRAGHRLRHRCADLPSIVEAA